MQVLFRTHWLALRAQASPSCSPGKEGGSRAGGPHLPLPLLPLSETYQGLGLMPAGPQPSQPGGLPPPKGPSQCRVHKSI